MGSILRVQCAAREGPPVRCRGEPPTHALPDGRCHSGKGVVFSVALPRSLCAPSRLGPAAVYSLWLADWLGVARVAASFCLVRCELW